MASRPLYIGSIDVAALPDFVAVAPIEHDTFPESAPAGQRLGMLIAAFCIGASSLGVICAFVWAVF